MLNEEKMKPETSLALIENMISTARNRISDNGHLYLLWGWTIFFCALVHFAALKWQLIERPEAVWILTWAAVAYQFVYLAKRKKKERVRSYTDEIEGYVWLTFVIMMALTGLLLGYNKAWPTMYPMFLVLYGMPTFLSGIILRFTPLKIGGLACWALAIAAMLAGWHTQLLLLALAVLAAWIIPGYILRAKYQHQKP